MAAHEAHRQRFRFRALPAVVQDDGEIILKPVAIDQYRLSYL